jgi:hypothetical protein
MPTTLTTRHVEINATHQELALERLIGNAEETSNWLAGHCFDKTRVGVWHLPEQLHAASVAELWTIALFEPRWAEQAMKLMRERFMAEAGDALVRRFEDEASEELTA